MIPPPPRSTLFPYTTLFRSLLFQSEPEARPSLVNRADFEINHPSGYPCLPDHRLPQVGLKLGGLLRPDEDRKSTRLNSSHRTISYAVFCLKKKKLMYKLDLA